MIYIITLLKDLSWLNIMRVRRRVVRSSNITCIVLYSDSITGKVASISCRQLLISGVLRRKWPSETP